MRLVLDLIHLNIELTATFYATLLGVSRVGVGQHDRYKQVSC